ncbi:hypothetical protein E1301_Tti022039 [Triplophysa tibetana]|uniref:Immunoglobulin domain-containing protein n=1 Tax=Triplophysa tibetana TaxID=1572043 RepID=A0A5A9NQQ3_9TELE|nr:hypothetical protein E1301_Tti022039 [Triplophysa tibetana]
MNSRMRNSFILFLVCGVFGDEVKITVMEGDSVTLHTDLTDMKRVIRIMWRFGEDDFVTGLLVMFESLIDKDFNDERFTDRLQIDKTGDLTIKNLRHKHSGRYEAEIIVASTGVTYKRFRVSVLDAPRGIGAGAGDVKSMSVMEGDSVTLHTDVQTQRDDLILWRFGDDGVLIAKDDKEDNKSSIYNDADGRFRDRLKLDDQTGSLTISHVKNTDAGIYKLKISSNNRQTQYKSFSVSFNNIQCCDTVEAVTRLVVTAVMGVAAVAAVIVLGYDIRSRRDEHKRKSDE